MSYHDYRLSQGIAAADPSFDSLIMAAYRKADTRNAEKLQAAWPDIINELRRRYQAPGGYIDGEVP